MRQVPVGLVLQPEPTYLSLLESLLSEADYLEICPETTWKLEDGALVPNGYHRLFRQLLGHVPAVAHGIGYSLTSSTPKEAERRRHWIARLLQDQPTFRYAWYSDHAGTVALGDEAVAFPLPPFMGAVAAARVRERLRELRAVCADVGFENTAHPFTLGHPMDEPAFYRSCLADGGWLVLDLHNVYTMATNLGFDAVDYVERLPLEKVIEVHVSGGGYSNPAWLPTGRSLRLDGHDSAVPEPVWELLERFLPRLPGVRGVTLERMEGTIEPHDVAPFAEEVRRLREISRQPPRPSATPEAPLRGPPPEHGGKEEVLAAALRAPDPYSALQAALPDLALDPDGVRMAALLVAKVRFERLLRGDADAGAWFDADPAAFTAAFKRYHAEVPSPSIFPSAEAEAWRRWRAGYLPPMSDYLDTQPADAPLDTLPNLGRVLVSRFATVGIRTVGDLRAVGEEQAWSRVRAALPMDACIDARLALAGACRGVRWHVLPTELKRRLSAEVRAG